MKTSKDSETIAIEALGFLAADEQELGRFLERSGLDPRRLRALAGTHEVMAAALSHVLGYEPLARAFAKDGGYRAEDLARAARELGATS